MKKVFGIIFIVILSLLLAGLFIVIVLKIFLSIDNNLFIGIVGSIAGTIVLDIVALIVNKGILKQIKKLLKREYIYNKSMKEELVRISYSYLIRIRVNNKYLLIKSKRINNIYQPVGGVYHITDDKYIRTKLGYYRDGSPGDSDDIRGVIKGKYLKKFDKWFSKKKGVENAPFREFKEELINSNILDSTLFDDDSLLFEYKGTKYDGVKDNLFYSQYAKYELLRYEIYEFIPNKEQLEYLGKIKDRLLYLATSSEIKTFGVDEENNTKRFGTQTPYILED